LYAKSTRRSSPVDLRDSRATADTETRGVVHMGQHSRIELGGLDVIAGTI
jgi:hypothetical protein